MMNGSKREKRTIVIVGCEHRVQPLDNESDQEFRQLLEALIEEHGIRFIGEEADPFRRSIAQEIADSRGIRYANVDVPQDVKDKIGLRSSMIFSKTKQLVEVVADSDRYVLAWNLVREHHMYKAFEAELTGLEPSLLICGRSHVKGFGELFGERHKVIPIYFGGSEDVDDRLRVGGES
ncbi:MAG: hypothetical protein ABSB35_10085 [Bryobacteraceae bacterium]|jgi:hypothetical protein